MSSKIHYFYIGTILILIGAGLFGGIKTNRANKRNIKSLERANELKTDSIKTYKAAVLMYEKKDSLLVEKVNSLDITTTNANSTTIINMPADSFILFITGHIDSAGAAINRR